MKRKSLIIILTVLLITLTGCAKEPNMEEVAKKIKQGETSFSLKVEGDIGNYMSEVFRQDVLILGEDINFKYSNGGKIELKFMPSYADTLVDRRVKVKMKLDPVTNNDYFKKLAEYEKLLYLHDYVVTNVTYDSSAITEGRTLEETFSERPETFDIYGAAVESLAVCRGYAEMLKYLLDSAGFENEIAVGTLKGESHAWNKVKFEGEWYNIDATANDTGVAYTTFMRTDMELIGYLEDAPTEYTKIPMSSAFTSEVEYYTNKNQVATSIAEAVDLLEKGNLSFRFKGMTDSELLAGLEASNLPLGGKTYAVEGDIFQLVTK